ncbi:MAG: nicotinate-nucleotide adenylyltransferase [Paracoccaceae bacterium]|nr:nicotinate-nucleotide adenylyltransferase [Paracoccaceae bacterium]
MAQNRDQMRSGLPAACPGMRIGLLGGSFDPPHAGHVHITLEAMKRCRLDRIWWLVSPGNPLKADPSAPLADRLTAARRVMRHPRVLVTDVETLLGTRYSAETLKRLLPLYTGVRFVWLMGADNLAGLHRWKNWRRIPEMVPIAVLARPGRQLRAARSVVARTYGDVRIPPSEAKRLASAWPPRWVLLGGPTVGLSSTAIRVGRR